MTLLDRIRSHILRLLLKPQWMRKAFRDRAWRLALLFLVAVAVYLPLSLYFPLWILAIGPLVWGIPHIFSSLRFQSRMITSERDVLRRAIFLSCGVWAGITLLRIATDVLMLFTLPPIVEVGSGILMFLGLSFVFGARVKTWLLSSAVLVPLTVAMWQMPLAVSGVLILAHNFVACLYWILAARATRDRVVAVGATMVFALIHILVFAKAFDPLINLMPSESMLFWSGLDIDSLGRTIAPWSENGSVWYRAVVLYAFGQSLHYFIWLKAIPDLQAPSEVPTSFRSSWHFLNRDFGKRLAMTAAVLALLPLAVWSLSQFAIASALYFAFASAHGYFEFATLGFVLTKEGRA